MDWNNINTNRDTSSLGPIEYDQKKVPALIRKHADYVRTKTYGQEMREAQARNAEVAGLIASKAVDVSNETKGRQDNVEIQFNSVQQELTDKDVISAPEIIAARNGESTLSDRLDKENQEVNTQLAHIALDITTLGAKADANYYDEVTQKYYTDPTRTTEAFDNTFIFRNAVNFLHENGGGTIYVPAGKYCFRDQIFWKSNVSMRGAGMETTFLYGEGEVFDLIKATEFSSTGSDGGNPEAWLRSVKFEDFQIDLKGLSSPYSNVNGKAFFILYMKNARFRNLILRNTIGTALGCDFLVDTVIENVHIYNAGRNWGKPNVINQRDPILIGQSGIGIGSCAVENEPVIVSNCYVYNSGNYGIFVETQNNPSGVKSEHAQIINNFVMGNRHGIGNKGSGGTLISGNSSINNTEAGVFLNEYSKDDIITNNRIKGNGGDGVIFEYYDGNFTIAGNNIEQNGKKGIKFAGLLVDSIGQGIISHNKIVDNTHAGIEIGSKWKNISIGGNIIRNNCKNVDSGYAAGILMDGSDKLMPIENIKINDNQIIDDQDVKTQIIGVKVRASTFLKDTLINDNNFIGYAYNTSLEMNIYALYSNVKIKDNLGVVTELTGSNVIEDGKSYVDVTFSESMVGSPDLILLTPASNDVVWFSDRNRLGFRINRDGTTGAIRIYWKAEKTTIDIA